MRPDPKSRSSLGQFFCRPPPLNVLASGPGWGGAISERSTNGGAAPASAGADRQRRGVEPRGAGARQKGRPQRLESTSTPRPAAGWMGLRTSCEFPEHARPVLQAREARCARSRERRRRLFTGKITQLLRARFTSARTVQRQWLWDDLGFVKYLRAYKALEWR